MSSLPSWVASAVSLSDQPRMPASTAPLTTTATGMTATMITAMMTAPSTASSFPIRAAAHNHAGQRVPVKA